MKSNTSITMNRATLDRLREAAKLDKRSVSKQIEMIVERHFAAAGAGAAPAPAIPAGNTTV